MKPLAHVSLEIESLARDLRAKWHLLDADHKVACIACGLLLFSIFLPWLSYEGTPTEMGINSGGAAHMLLAYILLRVLENVVQSKRNYAAHNDDMLRFSLYFILIGGCAFLLCGVVIIYFGSHFWETHHTVDIRFGFYVALFASMLISFSGFMRFFGNNKNRSDDPLP